MQRLLAALLVTATTCFSAAAHAQCSKDTDCKGDRICDAGECSTAPSPDLDSPDTAPLTPPVTKSAGERERFFDEGETEKPRKVRKKIGNPGLMVGGIVLAAAAPIVLAVGVATTPRCGDATCNSGNRVLTFGLIAVAMVGAAVPMIVIGAKRVPVQTLAVGPLLAPTLAGMQLRLSL